MKLVQRNGVDLRMSLLGSSNLVLTPYDEYCCPGTESWNISQPVEEGTFDV